MLLRICTAIGHSCYEKVYVLAFFPAIPLLTSEYPFRPEIAIRLPLTATNSKLIVVLAPYPNHLRLRALCANESSEFTHAAAHLFCASAHCGAPDPQSERRAMGISHPL